MKKCEFCEYVRTKICWGADPKRVYLCCIKDMHNDYRDISLIKECVLERSEK